MVGACHSEKKSAWNKPWAGAEKGQPGNRLKAWSEQKIWTENRSLVCIRRWIFVIIWCWGQKVFCPQLMPTNCSAAKQLPQFCKHSKSADLLRKSLLSHVWRVPSSKALSCKHERLFDLLTLASSLYNAGKADSSVSGAEKSKRIIKTGARSDCE